MLRFKEGADVYICAEGLPFSRSIASDAHPHVVLVEIAFFNEMPMTGRLHVWPCQCVLCSCFLLAQAATQAQAHTGAY